MADKAIVKKPKTPVAFPPPNHLRAYPVRDGDNWWTLQKQFSLHDPWTLIRYNFHTDNPAEVNWYLREYVGCTKTTADGKNYCFSSAATPGYLYLPRRNFKHGTGGGTGGDSGGEQQLKNDKAAESTVLWALGLTNSLAHVNFDVNGFQITSYDFERVARLIREGEIYVAHDPALGDNARYDAGVDTLYYGKKGGGDTHRAAMVIHEATHAALDARAEGINDVVSEIIAYIAQMLFIQVRDKNANMPGGDPLDLDIFRPAWRIARSIREENDIFQRVRDTLELHKALIAHPTYLDQFHESDIHYDGMAGYDGIKGHSYHWREEE
jgi:hypothetical protein